MHAGHAHVESVTTFQQTISSCVEIDQKLANLNERFLTCDVVLRPFGMNLLAWAVWSVSSRPAAAVLRSAD